MRTWIWLAYLLWLGLAYSARAEVTPAIQRAIRENTFRHSRRPDPAASRWNPPQCCPSCSSCGTKILCRARLAALELPHHIELDLIS